MRWSLGSWPRSGLVVMSVALAYFAAALIALWGIAHAAPTRQVVSGFGAISRDNRLVITQEWVVEALGMWFIAAVVIMATALAPASDLTHWIYRLTALMLIVVASWTGATGARTPVIWFKICVVLLPGTAALLLAASFL